MWSEISYKESCMEWCNSWWFFDLHSYCFFEWFDIFNLKILHKKKRKLSWEIFQIHMYRLYAWKFLALSGPYAHEVFIVERFMVSLEPIE